MQESAPRARGDQDLELVAGASGLGPSGQDARGGVCVSTTESTGLTHALAERSSALRYEDIPGDVREIARQCLLDWFGVTLGGSVEQAPRALLSLLASDGAADRARASVVGHRQRLAPAQAALVNGTASHVLDFDDVNITLPGHVSVAILGGALALAEQLDASACDLLTAFVAGYETACAIAVAVGPEPYLRGFHATGTIGTFGAAAACARLLALDPERTAIATGIAASQAAGLKCNFGTMTKSLHAGRACEAGLLAALLAAHGFTANPSAIEAGQGFAAAGGGEPAGARSDFSRWHLRENLFKYHAACFFAHSTLEGLRELIRARPLAAAEVEQISVHVSELELGACAIPEPDTGLEVKFSLAHLAAMALLGRATSTISDEDARAPDVIALRSRVVLVEDGTVGAPTRIEVRLRDGEVLSACQGVSRPERELGLQRQRLVGKFNALAEPILGRESARRLLDALGSLEDGARARELLALARP
ncbi:MAG TPA: MmgE/PrpD family protein [Solirubrobacteraceae bacterium]|jgi:2-methylcitrate dehydratase PrpD|nr:MmgE/PrpD family protein [Solirubrobacteraceae bacterium]